VVKDQQRALQDHTEARSDPFIRFTIPELLRESRQAVAPLLGASFKEVVFVANASMGVITVLRNLSFDAGDFIVYFGTVYGACENTVLHICETTSAECMHIEVAFPAEDEDLINLFRATALKL
jgi:hercynylcysteine S-oxide lyase